jgi:hypothetical protein
MCRHLACAKLRVETSQGNLLPENVAVCSCELTRCDQLAREQARRLFYVARNKRRHLACATLRVETSQGNLAIQERLYPNLRFLCRLLFKSSSVLL